MITSILFRYVLRQVSFWIALVLTTMLAFFFFLALLDKIGDSSYRGLLLAVWDVTLQLPQLLAVLLPICCAIGAAVALARLEARRELVMMRVLGLQQRRLAVWLAGASLVWIAAYVVTTEFALSASAGAERENAIARAGSFLDAQDAIWLHQTGGYARIERISASGHLLSGIVLLRTNAGQLDEIMYAQAAAYGEAGWVLRDVTALRRKADGWEHESFTGQAWDIALRPDVVASFNLPPSSLSLSQIVANIRQLSRFGESVVAHERVLYSRLADMLAIMMLVLATMWVARFVARPRPDITRLSAVAAFFGALLYYFATVVVRQFAIEENWPPALGAFLPVAVVSVLAFARLLKR